MHKFILKHTFDDTAMFVIRYLELISLFNNLLFVFKNYYTYPGLYLFNKIKCYFRYGNMLSTKKMC